MRFTSAHIRFFCLSNSLHHSLFPSAKPSLSLPLPVVAEHQEYNCAHNRKDQDAAGYSGQNPRNAAIRHVLRRRNDRGHQVAGRIGAPLRAAPIGRLVGHEHIPAAVHRGIYSMQRIPMAEVRLGGAAFSRSRVIKRAVQSERALFPGMQPIQEYQFPIVTVSNEDVCASGARISSSPAVRRRWSRPPGNRTSFPPLQRFPLRPPAPAGHQLQRLPSREALASATASSLCTFQAPCS